MQHCAGFISAESLYMFRASSAHHQEYYKTGTAAPGTGVTVAGIVAPYYGDVMTYLQL